jgi:hypothetical protein
VLGGYSDAWARHHVPSLDTFFTPWHGVLYAGLLATIIFLVGAHSRNRRRGYSWDNALPPGYGLSLIGVIFFAIGGVGDLIWHTLFGIELSIDGALSPTHLLLTSSLVLIVSGPYRAAWYRSNGSLKQSLLQSLPMLLSLTYMLSIITLIAQIANPFVNLWPSFSRQDPFTIQALAVVSILLQTILLMGLVLLTIRRWRLPYVWLKPSISRSADLRLFAFIMPVVLYLLYFLTLKLTTGVNWTIHLWLGTTFVAGIASFLLTFLLVPPEMPEKVVE